MLWERPCDRVQSDSICIGSDIAGSRGRRKAGDAALTTALCLVLLSASFLAVAPAAAQQAVSIIASPNPVDVTNDNDCTFSLGHCAQITTSDKDASINFANSGNFNAGLNGIYTTTTGLTAPIAIENAGDIKALSHGISAVVNGGGSDLRLNNSGGISSGADGINALIFSFGAEGNLALDNAGDIKAGSHGIFAQNASDGGDLAIRNSGTITSSNWGVFAFTPRNESRIMIENAGAITTTGPNTVAHGIFADTTGIGSTINLDNGGPIATEGDSANGIFARTSNSSSSIVLSNTGDIATAGVHAQGIAVVSGGNDSPITIDNIGDIAAGSYGISASSSGANSPVTVTSDGFIDPDVGMVLTTSGPNSPISANNAGTIEGTHLGLLAVTLGEGSPVSFSNSGKVTSTGDGTPFSFTQGSVSLSAYSTAVAIVTNAPSSNIFVENKGTIAALGLNGIGIYALASAAGSTTKIVNTGSVVGDLAALVLDGPGTATILNSGEISSASQLAFGVYGGSAMVINTGHITGYLTLDADDSFINSSGGVFETKLVSDFGPGIDLFRNENGATVQAATDPEVIEHSSFVNLERFENQGLITLEDNQVGDSFEISNSVGGRDLNFVASGNSTLAVDAFLGGPGSASDTFTINGDVSGKTLVDVNNTNAGPGSLNQEGIPVVDVNGNAKSSDFFLNRPIGAGLFNYDLFFTPTGSGIFALKSFLSANAFALPQLETAAQDLWHAGSDTWFDRTADLRVLLNGGTAQTAYAANSQSAEAPASPAITPAVWARGAGSWLGRDANANVSAYGRDYSYNLNRDLRTVDFQGGLDLGKRGLLSDNDILVFGALGGFVHADLDYDALASAFAISGGQVGGYATYLRGGLFVDTLVNVHLLEIDSQTLGFPNSMSATTVGVRTDSGYRFGSFSHGAFIEPLATISVNWAEIDGFSLGGNRVSFGDDPNVRGRLGLRVGTSTALWPGITMEPFVIGSLWGNLSDNNEATLVSSGTTFRIEDHLEDVWGEVSAGVNLFNPSANTSVFAKLDVTFGDNIDGVGGKAGMRVSW